jgi:hypothetical protein
VFINTLSPTFIFKEMHIDLEWCLAFYKLSNDLNKITGLHYIIYIKIYVGNYATFDGLVNGGNDNFKTSITYCEKTIIWIMFQKIKLKY